MITKTENKSKGREWERDNDTLTWKIFEEIKNHGHTTDRKHLLWRTKIKYKVLPNLSLPIIPRPLD